MFASLTGAITLDVPLTVEEPTGDRRYWDIAIEGFRRQTGEQDATEHLKLFAQYFRNSQRFLWYLSEDARAPMAESSANR